MNNPIHELKSGKKIVWFCFSISNVQHILIPLHSFLSKVIQVPPPHFYLKRFWQSLRFQLSSCFLFPEFVADDLWFFARWWLIHSERLWFYHSNERMLIEHSPKALDFFSQKIFPFCPLLFLSSWWTMFSNWNQIKLCHRDWIIYVIWKCYFDVIYSKSHGFSIVKWNLLKQRVIANAICWKCLNLPIFCYKWHSISFIVRT